MVRAAPLGDGRQRAGRRDRPGPSRPGEPGPPRGALPRRVPALPRRRDRGDAAAVGGRRGHHRPRGRLRDLPRAVAGGAGRQPVPLWQLPRHHRRLVRVLGGPAAPLPTQAHGPDPRRVDIWMEVRPQGRSGPSSARSASPPTTSAPGWRRHASARPTATATAVAAQRLLPGPRAGRAVAARARRAGARRRGPRRRPPHPARADPGPAPGLDGRGPLRRRRPGEPEATIALALRSADAAGTLPAAVVGVAS